MTGMLAALALFGPTPAYACGGFVCEPARPVEQAGEDIFFLVDESAGSIEMHVQVEYEGPAEEFAWIVPAPGVPELTTSFPELFATLGSALQPEFRLDTSVEGTCKRPRSKNLDSGSNLFATSTYGTSTVSSSGTIQIVGGGEVGPYETVILQAQDAGNMLGWLNDNGYDLPASLEPALAPYIGAGQSFVALKLQKDKGAGDLEPLAMAWTGDKVSIPIQLTAIAATPDMPLRVNILGPARAVPESYLHLDVNPFTIDWWDLDSKYNRAVRRAAGQAGGHGFATDFSGVFTNPGIYNDAWPTRLAGISNTLAAWEFVEELAWSLPMDASMVRILEDLIPVPPGVTVEDFFGCPSCFAEDYPLDFDIALAKEVIDQQYIAPRGELSDRFTSGLTLTRMTSSLSPEDMTVDPVFGFNPDLPEVGPIRRASMVTECSPRTLVEDAPRRLEVAGYPDLLLPGESFFRDYPGDIYDYIEDLHEPANQVIEATARVGQPEMVQDNRALIADKILAFNEEHKADRRNCGCAVGGPAPMAWSLLPLGLLALRRRQRGGPNRSR